MTKRSSERRVDMTEDATFHTLRGASTVRGRSCHHRNAGGAGDVSDNDVICLNSVATHEPTSGRWYAVVRHLFRTRSHIHSIPWFNLQHPRPTMSMSEDEYEYV